MGRLSKIFSRSETILQTMQGCAALSFPKTATTLHLARTPKHSDKGCLMCAKILAALHAKNMEDGSGNPGWLNFFVLDGERSHPKDLRSADALGGYTS